MIVLYQEPIMVWGQLATRLEWCALLLTVISLVAFFIIMRFDGSADLMYIFGVFLCAGLVWGVSGGRRECPCLPALEHAVPSAERDTVPLNMKLSEILFIGASFPLTVFLYSKSWSERLLFS